MKYEKYYVIIVFLLITVIYLYPAFLGKVDTPLDIRNTYMYPWRYHEVDKKINVIELWKYSDNNSNIIELKPQSSSTQIYELKIEKANLNKLQNISKGNFYFTFNLKKEPEENDKAIFVLQLFNKTTNQSVSIPYSYSPVIAEDFSTWYKAYFNLDKIIQNLNSVRELGNYNVQLVAENNHSDLSAKYTFTNLQLICDDRSNVSTVKNFYINDLVQMFTPFREYYSKALKQGRIPFWNNYTFTGTEFISEPQMGYFHPLYLFSYLLFDHFSAHLFILFVCLILCGFGAYLLARYWGLGYAASIFAGLVYMFHPFNAKWLSYEHVLINSATLPYLLLMYEKYLKEKNILNKYLIFSILLTGLIFISGHLQKVYYALFFFFLFIIFRFILNVILAKQNPTKILISSILIFGIGLLIGSIVLVQFFPLFLHSHREPFSKDFIKAASIPLKAFIGLVYPFYGGHPGDSNLALNPMYVAGFFRNYVYFGLLPFVCALFSLKIIFKNKLVLFFFLSIIFS
ncbi:MAG: hypothetical protein HYZ79_04710, partial [Candidatus Melainabacteria bacterium]|nr:hypothetical protein [Candidatus Melainabacteria bacterium]